MSGVHKFTLTLRKSAKNRIDATKLAAHLQHIKLRAFNASRVKSGWKGKVEESNLEKPKVKGDSEVEYFAKFTITCRPARARRPEVVEAQYEAIREVISSTGKMSGWELAGENGDKIKPKAQAYAEAQIPDDWTKQFAHLYEREDQISIVLSSIKAGIESNWADRFHVVLVGPPAGGKSDLLRGIKELLGNDAVLEYDATATTQAGATKDLDSRAEIPRVMLIEELEKVDENSLRWLLGVLDHRAEIRKTNFRVNIHKSVKLLCVSTVNDYDAFLDMMSGALASRFPHHVYCPRPGRQVLQKILEREVARVKGKVKWIKPALDYAEKAKISDPRKVISICLCGRDDLLTGEYQSKLDRTDAATFHKNRKSELRKQLAADSKKGSQ